MTTPPTDVPSVDFDQALANFKAKFCTPGSCILDAWIDAGFIKYQVDPDRLEDLGKLEQRHMFEGVPTVITLWPKY